LTQTADSRLSEHEAMAPRGRVERRDTARTSSCSGRLARSTPIEIQKALVGSRSCLSLIMTRDRKASDPYMVSVDVRRHRPSKGLSIRAANLLNQFSRFVRIRGPRSHGARHPIPKNPTDHIGPVRMCALDIQCFATACLPALCRGATTNPPKCLWQFPSVF
jgi:hypothetical protein